jgi:hypothetical protein
MFVRFFSLLKKHQLLALLSILRLHTVAAALAAATQVMARQTVLDIELSAATASHPGVYLSGLSA